jgi:hypothetical protein
VPRALASLLVLLLLTAACTGEEPAARTSPAPEDPVAADEPTAEPEPEPRTCRVDALEDQAVVDLRGPDPVTTSHELSRRTHRCADTVVVAADDPWAAALAVSVAIAEDAPLLLTTADDHSTTQAILDDLEPDDVLTVGLTEDGTAPTAFEGATPVVASDTLLAAEEPAGDAPEDGPAAPDADGSAGDAPEDGPAGDAPEDGPAAPEEDDTNGTSADDAGAGPAVPTMALGVLVHLGADRAHAVAIDDDESRAAALASNGGTTPLLPIPNDDESLVALAAELPATLRVEVVAADDEEATALANRLVDVGVDAEVAAGPRWDDRATGTVWLVDPRDGATAAAAAATAAGRDETLLPIDGRDLRAGRDRTARLLDADPARTVLVGDVTEHADWQLPTLLEGPRLPTGGLTLFESERIVALYGTPSSTALGALGEQDLDAAVARAREIAEPYGADGREVVPAFEMIVTIASAEAGDQRDYSRRLDPGSFRPWIDRAAEEGFYVILDLQPGRTDFLTQAREYEELLLEPHVGLALDPEWRLEDDQVHLRQIGSVDAAEVQEVADWLAALVREHHLPQKLLVLHQFRHSMLPDRDEVVAPPELAVVVHMDGQGPIGTKYETYDAITRGAEDRWWWGWKNFYDEDQPTPTPQQVLDLDPLPVFVSYQ